MKFACSCGNVLSNTASPSAIEHYLISEANAERLQSLVDEQLDQEGGHIEWYENWSECSPSRVWKCHKCERLYVFTDNEFETVKVYALEKIGI